MDEDQLVGVGVLVEIVLHALLRGGEHHMAVAIHEDRCPAREIVAHRREMEAFETAVAEHLLLRDVGGHAVMRLRLYDLGGGMAMIEERIVVGEALGGEKLLRIQGAVGLPELGVPLVRYVAQTMVVWHIECVLGFRSFSGEDKGGTYSERELEHGEEEDVLPLPLVDPIGEIAVVRHGRNDGQR
jgi:hypothetical protein